MQLNIPSPLQKINLKNGRSIFVKREDLIHPLLSGNKYRKLKYNIKDAIKNKCSGLISFGGAYSNHIHALSFACNYHDIPLTLFIRGEDVSNPTIDFVRENKAKIVFIDRKTYKLRADKQFLIELREKYPGNLIIPEGGTNMHALKGIKEMMDEIYNEVGDEELELAVAYGSGGTSIGMMNALRSTDTLNVFPVLKMPNFKDVYNKQCESLAVIPKNIKLHDGFHFGGYAKYKPELIQFINSFKKEHSIPLDPIYTGKLFYGLMKLIEMGLIPENKKIVVIHSGGLQGIKGFNSLNNHLIKV